MYKRQEQDYALAIHWSEEAARGGHAAAAYTLGLAYRDGWGVTADAEQAFIWFLQGAELGSMESQYEVAVIFSARGNEQEAKKWLSQAAQQGHLGALMALREKG